MAIVDGKYVDDFTYNDMMDKALATGQNFAGNTFVNGTDFDVSKYLEGLGSDAPGADTGLFGQGMDFLNDNKAGIGAATQLGGLALTTYNAFGPGKELHDTQMKSYNNQIKAQENSLAKQAALDAAWAKHA